MAPPPITRLLLVRHGESESNVTGIFGGEVGCTGLSERGRRQAEALRLRWQDHHDEVADVTHLYASVLPRAIETAELVRPALPAIAHADVRTDCDLCELHPGEVDGLPFTEYLERYSAEHAGRWREDPHVLVAPGGESWAGFCERAAAGLRRVADAHEGESIVVACHGGVVEASCIVFGGLAELGSYPRQRFSAANASITEWTVRRDSWRLVRANDFAHTYGI